MVKTTAIYLFVKRFLFLFSFLAMVLGWTSPAQANVSASVDNNAVSEFDLITLTVRADRSSAADRLDISAIEQDFEVLNSQQSSQINIINGRKSAQYDRIFTLAPKRAGTLTIPALDLDGERTAPITIKVTPGPQDPRKARARVFMENEVSKQEVYVQEQLVYTLRIYHSVALDNPSLSQIDIENALQVKALGDQKNYETIIEGIRYSVIEINYSIIPETSGKLVIPEQSLTAVTRAGRYGAYQRDNRRIRTKSPTQVVNVLPIPAEYPADQPWLPTEQLKITDSWADKEIKLKVGEPVTRNITLSAIGVTSAQLPAVRFAETEGIKVYPDQPALDDRETATGFRGERSESAAIVPAREGDVELPGTTVTWWNTRANRLEKSIIPTLRLAVSPAPQSAGTALLPPASLDDQAVTGTPATNNPGSGYWPWLSAILMLCWLVTLWLWLQARSAGNSAAARDPQDAYKERIETRYQAHKALLQAGKDQNPAAARPALIAWFRAVFPDRNIDHLDDIRRLNCHPQLNDLLLALDQQLYGTGAAQQGWDSDALLSVLEQIRRSQKREPLKSGNARLKPLYPM